MCSTCDQIARTIRWSGNVDDVAGRINVEVGLGRLDPLGQIDPDGPYLMLGYRCRECGHRWRLTHPDHAMRGGFERE